MTSCSAPNCSNHSRNGFTFHRFPADSNRRKQWLINCKRQDWTPTQNDRLCSYHFEESQIEQNRVDGKKRLRPYAIPTRFAPKLFDGFNNKSYEPKFESTNMYGYHPIDTFLEVKPEPTEIAFVSQSVDPIQCFESVTINYNKTDMVCISQVQTSKKKRVKMHKCDVCTKSFNRRYNMLQHAKLHTGERNHKCDLCSKSFQTKPVLLQHIKSHTNERNHKCDVCTMRFKTKSEVFKHMERHTDERNYKCHICTKTFKTKNDVSLHIKCHTVERNHKCAVCTKSFKTKSEVAKHMKRHTEERNSVCYICTKSFKTKHDVVLHMKSHTDERNHKCNICSRTFKTRNELVKHVKYHSDERNYKCEVCAKRFKTSNHVLQHMKSHSDERNYRCDVCAKSFKMRNAMVRHMISHSDERNYKCDVCSMGFKTKHVLVKHMKRHKCEICIGNLKVKDYTMEHRKQRSMQKLLHGTFLCGDKDGKPRLSVMDVCDVNVKQENVDVDVGSDVLENFAADAIINNSSDALIEAKPGSTELIYLTQCTSSQCSNVNGNLSVVDCKNEPLHPDCNVTNDSISNSIFLNTPSDATNDFTTKLEVTPCTNEDEKHKNPITIQSERARNFDIRTDTETILSEHIKYQIDHRKTQNKKQHELPRLDKNQCNICAKTFKTRIILSKHVQRHSIAKTYQCDVCTKRFKMKGELAKHVKCHDNERTHKCDICTKSFKTHDKMTNHMKLHTDQRNYKCDVCTKGFKSKNNLTVHMQHHSNERKYECDVCSKSFKTKCNMVQHMKSHVNGRKRYVRIQCEHKRDVVRGTTESKLVVGKPLQATNEIHPIMDETPKSMETIYLSQAFNDDVKIEEELTTNVVNVKSEFSNTNVQDFN